MGLTILDYRGPITGFVDFPGPVFFSSGKAKVHNGLLVQYTLRGYYEIELPSPEDPGYEAALAARRLSPYATEGFIMKETQEQATKPYSMRVHGDRGDLSAWSTVEPWDGLSAAYTLQQSACFTYTSELWPDPAEEDPENPGQFFERAEWPSPNRWVYGGLYPQRNLGRRLKESPEEDDPLYGTFNPKPLSLELFYGDYDFGDWIPANPPGEIWVYDKDHIVFDHFDLMVAHNTVRGEGIELVRVRALDRAAQKHAEWLVAQNRFQHEGPGDNSVSTRASQEGYLGWAGENLAANLWTVQDAVDGWVGSPGHYANLMNPNWEHFGCGYASGGIFGNMWVVVFGKAQDGYTPTVVPYDAVEDALREREILPYRVTHSLPTVCTPGIAKSDYIPVLVNDRVSSRVIGIPLPHNAQGYTASVMDVSADGQKMLVALHGDLYAPADYGRPTRSLLRIFEFDFKTGSYTTLKEEEDLHLYDEDTFQPRRRFAYLPEITSGGLFDEPNELQRVFHHYCLHKNPDPDTPVPDVPDEFVQVYGWQDRLLSESGKYVTPICGQGTTPPPVQWPLVQTFVSVDRHASDSRPDSFYEVTFDYGTATRVQIPDDYYGTVATWLRDNYPESTMVVVVSERVAPKAQMYSAKQIVSAQYVIEQKEVAEGVSNPVQKIVYAVVDVEYTEQAPEIQYPETILSGTLTIGITPTAHSTGDYWDYTDSTFKVLGDWQGRWVFHIKESTVQIRRDPPPDLFWPATGKVRLYHADSIDGEPIILDPENENLSIITSDISVESGSSVTQVIHSILPYTGGGLSGSVGNPSSPTFYSVGAPTKFYDRRGEHTVSYFANMEITEGCLPAFGSGVTGYPLAKAGDEWSPEQIDLESSVDIWSAISFALRNPSTNPQWDLISGRVLKQFETETWLSPLYGGYHGLTVTHYWTYDSGVSTYPPYYNLDPGAMPVLNVFYESIDGRCAHLTTYVGHPEHVTDSKMSSRYTSPVLTGVGVKGAPVYEAAVPDPVQYEEEVAPEGMRQPWQTLQCGSYNPVLGKLVRGVTAPVCWTGRYLAWPEEWPEVITGDVELFVNMEIPDWGNNEDPL